MTSSTAGPLKAWKAKDASRKRENRRGMADEREREREIERFFL